MLVNTGSVDANGNVVIKETIDEAGTTWYTGTIVKKNIVDYYNTTSDSKAYLHFRQNTSYMLIITFQKDAVRIITVIPQVEEWLPGEGDADDPWQEQALGQPQMFDNIVWSDRNLGADHYDPTGQYYEQAVGYFYQSGRNIPYYPFKYENYNGYDEAGNKKKPDLKDMGSQDISNSNTTYTSTVFRFYPVVDDRLLRMTSSKVWTMANTQKPQMVIPESAPTDTYFDFLKGNDNGNTGLTDEQNVFWEKGQQNQPVSGAWLIPSSKDFLTIFPSTPHAGNITFRAGGNNSTPMNWNPAAMSEKVKVLRVTVPYYDTVECTQPWQDNPSEMYKKAWNTLKDNQDPGSTIYIPGTNDRAYATSPGYAGNPSYEPDGDPEDGFASVYVISREEGDLVEPDILKGKDIGGEKDWAIKSWGTIYAIKRIYTSQAYRMRWRVLSSSEPAKNPRFYVEICRYRCNADSKLTVDNYKSYDWEHYAAKLYFTISGLGDWTGHYINFGTECQYATSDPISEGKTSAVQIKVSGDEASNAFIAVVKNVVNRNFGMQIRPIGGGK